MAPSHPTIDLVDGNTIPVLGLGVFRAAKGAEAQRAVTAALELGYRHIDTAAIYRNEADVGAAVRDCGIPREQIFVTTKLWNEDQGYESALRACDQSLERLKMDYVDLYLLHWPVPGKRLESWRALERLKQEGRVRSIGVSNFLVRHLEELRAAADIQPSVNQIEAHPFLIQKETREHCARQKIAVEAYSPLTKGKRLGHPTLVEVARRHGRSQAQVLIRWSLQHGMIVLPKSVRPERIQENADVFSFGLAKDDMRLLDDLDEGSYTGWDPTDVP
jgi:diketogulonate reductase-like aldo/keto reductase